MASSEIRIGLIRTNGFTFQGALTHGDRRATESRDLSQFNLDTKYGRTALDVTLKSIIKQMSPIVQPPVEYKGDFFHGKKRPELVERRCANRILLLQTCAFTWKALEF